MYNKEKTRLKKHRMFVLTDDRNLERFLGVEIGKNKDGFHMHQRFLINRILAALNLDDDSYEASKRHTTVPASKPLLIKYLNGEVRKLYWNYRSIIGMLNYLADSTRPDISMAVHQTARFCINPMLSNKKAVVKIGKYLRDTKGNGLYFKLDKSLGIECYADADFASGWNISIGDDPNSVLSRTGYIILFYRCPVYWKSTLQTEISLNTTEVEYIVLSQALRSVIPMMNLIEELQSVLRLEVPIPIVNGTAFEDNMSTIAVAKAPSMLP